MTEILELVGISVPEILKHEDDCPFCQENEEPDKKPESKIIDEWDEDIAAARHEMIGNNSGTLEKNMEEPRPSDWKLRYPVRKCNGDHVDLGEQHKVVANPHHLIPGNESLKKVPAILKWIFEQEGVISNDVGYDVNRGENGVWLPSNNGMRGNSDYQCETVKITYANSVQPNGGCFHDRHPDYSKFVSKILKKIADRMDGIDVKIDCPYKTEKNDDDDRFKPPWALVARLDGVSNRLSGYLKKYNAGDGFRPPLYTSRLALERNKILVKASKGEEINIQCPVCGGSK